MWMPVPREKNLRVVAYRATEEQLVLPDGGASCPAKHHSSQAVARTCASWSCCTSADDCESAGHHLRLLSGVIRSSVRVADRRTQR